MPNQLQIAEVLDASWWQEQVPSTFANSSFTVIDQETAQETTEQYNWSEYLTMNGRQWKIDVADENENLIKSFAYFTRNGKPVAVPSNYANEKIRLVTKREFEIYQNDCYLIHLISDLDINSNPKDIIWPKQVTGKVNTDPYHWQGDIKQKVHFLYHNGIKIAFCTENITHTYNSKGEETLVKHEFYFHTAQGNVNKLKEFEKEFEDATERQKRLRTRRFYMVEEAKAYTIGTTYETEALDYFKDYKVQFDNYIETGDTTILTTLAQADTDIEWWLLEDYELPNEQIVTIQQALIAYLTI